jgi:hypothetical protein
MGGVMTLRRRMATLLTTLMATSLIAVEAEAAESIVGVWKLLS